MNERQYKILEAIISDYIQTAEPIGSRTIAKKYGLGVSSTTIRNEMSDLEEMGFIRQPHTSAGRVPSDKGYRLYVDSMMRRRALSDEETLYLQRIFIDHINHVEFLCQETAKAIARLTNLPTFVSEPSIKKTKIAHIQLVPLDERSLLLVVVTDAKAVKSQAVDLPVAPDYETLVQLSRILRDCLQGQSIRGVTRATVDKLLAAFGKWAYVLMPVLGAAAGLIQAEDDVRIITSGVRNLLAFPEFADIEKARAIFHALEERELLVTVLALAQRSRVEVIIGAETEIEALRDCSIIKANYSIDNRRTGVIGVIGPMRMDYTQAVSVLEGILVNIDAVIHALSGV